MSISDQNRFLAHLPAPQPLLKPDGTAKTNNKGAQLRRKPITTNARLIGLVIAMKLNPETGEWIISRQTLADLTGLGLRSITQGLAELESAGYFQAKQASYNAPKTFRLAVTCPATCPNKEAHNNPGQPTFRGSPEARTFLTASEWQHLINNLPKDADRYQQAKKVLPDMNPEESLEIMNAELMKQKARFPKQLALFLLNDDKFMRNHYPAKPAEAKTLEPADLANDYNADLADEYDLPSFDEQARAYGFDNFGQNPF
jgi:hypothetical protein